MSVREYRELVEGEAWPSYDVWEWIEEFSGWPPAFAVHATMDDNDLLVTLATLATHSNSRRLVAESLLEGSLSEMDEPIRLVAGSEPPAAAPADTGSFEAFVIETQTRLFGSLCLMTGSRHEAEEIAQEAYVRVLERWDHVQRLDDPTGYLFVIALNVFRKRLRRTGIALRRSIGTGAEPGRVRRGGGSSGRPRGVGAVAYGSAGGAHRDCAPRLLL